MAFWQIRSKARWALSCVRAFFNAPCWICSLVQTRDMLVSATLLMCSNISFAPVPVTVCMSIFATFTLYSLSALCRRGLWTLVVTLVQLKSAASRKKADNNLQLFVVGSAKSCMRLCSSCGSNKRALFLLERDLNCRLCVP
eukprot:scaffold39837_cov17-Prasinocladus_malaysianus.AAC.2